MNSFRLFVMIEHDADAFLDCLRNSFRHPAIFVGRQLEKVLPIVFGGGDVIAVRAEHQRALRVGHAGHHAIEVTVLIDVGDFFDLIGLHVEKPLYKKNCGLATA